MAKLYATREEKISAREIRNMERVRGLAAQGMVLLENDGILPFRGVKTVAAFGSGVRHTVKGGTGSGDVNSRSVYNVEQGLTEAGYELISTSWLDRYDAICDAERAALLEAMQQKMAEGGVRAAIDYAFSRPKTTLEVPEITPEDLAVRADAAIYVIARNSGEGADRLPIPGDYELTENERQNIAALAQAYGHLVVVLNVGGVMDTKFLRAQQGVGAILLMSQAGNVSGLVLADVLSGKSSPSGHLTTTWAENYADYPCAETFSHMNGDTDDEYYREGIYVGYRYFDSFNVAPAYPFGYGKSYASFSLTGLKAALLGAEVAVYGTFTNTSASFAGSEVLQVYYSAPQGHLEKPYQELAGFAKTKLLQPGESQTLEIRFPVADMASYCERYASWVLEPGKYFLRAGTHSRATAIIAAVEIPEKKPVRVLQNRAVCDTEMDLLHPDCPPFGYPEEQAQKDAAPVLPVDLSVIPTETVAYSGAPAEMTTDRPAGLTLQDVREGKATLSDLVAQLTVEEMAILCVGAHMDNSAGGGATIGAQSLAVPGAAGDTTSRLFASRGIPNVALADGPAGLRLQKHFVTDAAGNPIPGLGDDPLGWLFSFGQEKPERPEGALDYYQYCTAIPIATLLAQTWDMDAVAEAGDIVGGEMEEFHAAVWLAPGMNIHRNPLCGRNFEYYSEDPLLAGRCAAADTMGVQRHPGCGTCIKHFALNNNEDNRTHCNAHCSERAIREIYVKGFEICVKESQPLSLMTSYNLINGEHAANNYDTVTAMLRDEWGFDGLVMTDWGTTGDFHPGAEEETAPKPSWKYPDSDAAGCIRAGNDLTMPGTEYDVQSIIRSVGAQAGEVRYPITKAELQRCAFRVLQLVLRCQDIA